MPAAVKIHTLSSALLKARKYCAYQERSQQEVRDKLYDLGLHRNDVEQAVTLLIEEGFINEQRFAVAFAGGKFRIKKWGKVKIKIALKAKKVSDACIREAFRQISNDEYQRVLLKILTDKRKKLPGKPDQKGMYQVAQYAISRGFEPDLVWELLKMNA